MLKESFANLLAYIPSDDMRRELSVAFGNLLKKIFSKNSSARCRIFLIVIIIH